MNRSSSNTRRTGPLCVAFDVVGTLIHPDPPAPEVYRAVAAEFGSELTVAEIAERFSENFHRFLEEELPPPSEWRRRDRLRTGDDHEERFWRRMVTTILSDVSDPEACFASLYDHFGRPEAWRCFPEVPDVLDRLRAGGIRCVIASNFDSRLNAICEGLPALRRIGSRTISAPVGYRKPSAHFYSAVIEACGPDCGPIVMVGDDEINDIQGARAAGLEAVKIVRRGSEPGALKSLDGLLGRLERLQNEAAGRAGGSSAPTEGGPPA